MHQFKSIGWLSVDIKHGYAYSTLQAKRVRNEREKPQRWISIDAIAMSRIKYPGIQTQRPKLCAASFHSMIVLLLPIYIHRRVAELLNFLPSLVCQSKQLVLGCIVRPYYYSSSFGVLFISCSSDSWGCIEHHYTHTQRMVNPKKVKIFVYLVLFEE